MNTKKYVIIICLMLMLTTIPFSLADNNTNNIETTWMQTYGRFYNEELGVSVQQTDDGGFIAVGSISKSLFDIRGNKDVWLMKFDETGSIIWNKTFGGRNHDEGNHVQQTNDGGFIITGDTESYGNGKNDVWLIKTDENGEKLWDITFGKSGFDSGKEVIQTIDGGYAIVGWGNQSGGGLGNVLVIKVDSDGNKIWDRSFGDKGHNYGDGIRQTNDGGFIIIGSSWIPDESNSYDMWLIKIDKNGNMMWDKKFGGTYSDHGWSIDLTVDGDFIILGKTNFGSSGDIWLIKTDEKGNKIWDKTFAGRGSSVHQTSDGGYIIAGSERKNSRFDFSDGLLIKTDSNGVQEWRETFGGNGADIFSSVQQTEDNGYIITGFTGQWKARFGYDLWLLKINSGDYMEGTEKMTDDPGPNDHYIYLKGTLISLSVNRALSIGSNWICLNEGYIRPTFDDDKDDVELIIDGEIQEIEGYAIFINDFKGIFHSRTWLSFPLIRLLTTGNGGQPFIEINGTCSSIEYWT